MNPLLIRRRGMMKAAGEAEDKTLTFTALTDNSSVQLTAVGTPYDLSLEYNIGGGWTTYTLDDVITIDIGEQVKFRGINDRISIATTRYIKFVMSGMIEASGDITSLLNGVGGDVYIPQTGLCLLFDGCTSLIQSPRLPSTTLGSRCYSGIFSGCGNITSHDVATLNDSTNVFRGNTSCASLTIHAETPPTIASTSITGLKSDCIIYVPAGSVAAYQAAQYWSDRAAYIQANPNT